MGATRPRTPRCFQVLDFIFPLPENCTSILNLHVDARLRLQIEGGVKGVGWNVTWRMMGLLFVVRVGWSRGVNEVNMCRKLGCFVLLGGQMWGKMRFFEGWE